MRALQRIIVSGGLIAAVVLLNTWAHGQEKPTVLTNSLGMKLVLIPAGEFWLGSSDSTESALDNEKPRHRVEITKPFYLGQTEVTQAQWKAVMGTEPWKGNAKTQEEANCAATFVSWHDATTFCEKLSEKEAATYQLPTEAQWEYACRGGTDTRWSFGDSDKELPEYAWFSENAADIGENYSHVVAKKKPNPFGLYDMHGNVWEWCRDVYDDNTYRERNGTTSDPVMRAAGRANVLRGGSWYSFPLWSRSGFRYSLAPNVQNYSAGFRVLRVK